MPNAPHTGLPLVSLGTRDTHAPGRRAPGTGTCDGVRGEFVIVAVPGAVAEAAVYGAA